MKGTTSAAETSEIYIWECGRTINTMDSPHTQFIPCTVAKHKHTHTCALTRSSRPSPRRPASLDPTDSTSKCLGVSGIQLAFGAAIRSTCFDADSDSHSAPPLPGRTKRKTHALKKKKKKWTESPPLFISHCSDCCRCCFKRGLCTEMLFLWLLL